MEIKPDSTELEKYRALQKVWIENAKRTNKVYSKAKRKLAWKKRKGL